jgi:hypothetical protein
MIPLRIVANHEIHSITMTPIPDPHSELSQTVHAFLSIITPIAM